MGYGISWALLRIDASHVIRFVTAKGTKMDETLGKGSSIPAGRKLYKFHKASFDFYSVSIYYFSLSRFQEFKWWRTISFIALGSNKYVIQETKNKNNKIVRYLKSLKFAW